MQSTLGGVNVSSSATHGVFDFSLDEIQERYKHFLAVKKQEQPTNPFEGEGFQDLTETPEYFIEGAQAEEPKQVPPQQAVMTDEQSKPDKLATLDQFIDNIISPPEKEKEKEIEKEVQDQDMQYNTAQFFNESMQKHHDVDVLLNEIEH